MKINPPRKVATGLVANAIPKMVELPPLGVRVMRRLMADLIQEFFLCPPLR